MACSGLVGATTCGLGPVLPATLGDDLAPGDGRRGGLGRTGVVLKLSVTACPPVGLGGRHRGHVLGHPHATRTAARVPPTRCSARARPPPAAATPLLAFRTGDERRYQADAIGRAIRRGPGAVTRPQPRSVDPARGRHPHAAAASVSTVWRRGAVGLAVRFRDRATDATTMPTIVTCKTKPPSSAATPGPSDGAVMGCGACLSTACLHPTHCGVFHVEHVRNDRRSR
jgi:hypothetical protein